MPRRKSRMCPFLICPAVGSLIPSSRHLCMLPQSFFLDLWTFWLIIYVLVHPCMNLNACTHRQHPCLTPLIKDCEIKLKYLSKGSTRLLGKALDKQLLNNESDALSTCLICPLKCLTSSKRSTTLCRFIFISLNYLTFRSIFMLLSSNKSYSCFWLWKYVCMIFHYLKIDHFEK